MKLDGESGTIERGKRADLVILDADPLENISNVRRVHAVVAAGRMFSPAPLWRAAGFATAP
jgi:imidazolonepropionase-like amidohydrolase